jgi:replicative DNA helicase
MAGPQRLRLDVPTGAEGFRTPPHSIEAEQAVIGGLLLDPAAWDQVADSVNDEDF